MAPDLQAALDKELTLAWVNGFRAARGLAPVDEFPENRVPGDCDVRARTCPVAGALGGRARVSASYVLIDGSGVEPPEYVRRTVTQFDREIGWA